MTRCLFISTEFPPGPGGIGIHAFHVINELKSAYGWDFLILTNQENIDDRSIQIFNKNYHSTIINLKESPSIFLLIKKIVFIIKESKKYNPDLILASGKHSVWFGSL